MNRFEVWMLKRIFKKAVRQGVYHRERIIFIYSLITQAARVEFSKLMLDEFLIDCHKISLDDNNKTLFTDNFFYDKDSGKYRGYT